MTFRRAIAAAGYRTSIAVWIFVSGCARAPEKGTAYPEVAPSAVPVDILVSDIKTPSTKPMVVKPKISKSDTPTFGDDVAFMGSHTDVVVLGEGTPARVVVAPGYQGRVMTSTARGESGPGYGWINRDAIASGERKPHMNVFGGEDRFWLGPEGGQYGLYFPPGAPYVFDHWQVPDAIDWGGWVASDRTPTSVAFRKEMHVVNHLGTEFDVRVDRKVVLLSVQAIGERLGTTVPSGVAAVGYESDNTITNIGKKPWTKPRGLLSVWILGMYQPSPKTTIVLPFEPGPESELGPVVNDAYFGKVPPSRLKVGEGALFFRGDGQERGKIGIPRKRARPIAGSYDAAHGVLTIVEYALPDGASDYVNSMWEKQKAPYGGDVVNSYNDGPPAPGKPPLGPFYELETSSPAAALAPGASLMHVHRTIHLEGPRAALDPIAKKILGVGLDEIEAAFSAP
jgi:hypothetical protein